MSGGDQLDSKMDQFGPVPELPEETTAAAERYIRRRALDAADAALLVDALLGPLTTRQGGRIGSKRYARGAA